MIGAPTLYACVICNYFPRMPRNIEQEERAFVGAVSPASFFDLVLTVIGSRSGHFDLKF